MSDHSHLSPAIPGLLEQLSGLSKGLQDGAPGAREGLMGTCAALINELAHPMESILQLLWAQPTHHVVLRMAVQLQIPETLASNNGSPKSSKQLADAANAEPLLVSRMMKHLAAMGTVKEVDVDSYASTPLSLTLAQPVFKDTAVFIQDDILPVHVKAPQYFSENGYKSPTDGSDGPFQYAYDCKGQNMFQYFENHAPEMGRRFGSMMTAWSYGRPRWFENGYYPVAERLVEGAKKGDDETFLVDVGGGRGHDIEGIKQLHSQSISGKLILEDRPEVLGITEVSEEIEKLPHDFNTPQPVKGSRAYYFHSIMQDWSDDECRHILQQIVPVLEKGYSKILLNEFVLPNKGAHWALTCLDWELMSSLSARQRTEGEFRKIVEPLGLKITGIWKHPQGADSLIEVELA